VHSAIVKMLDEHGVDTTSLAGSNFTADPAPKKADVYDA
jgi:hypothetical protein